MARTSPTDEELVADAKLGCEDAMVALYHRYRPRVLGFVLRMAGDRDLAEEVFCETFAAFFRALERFESRGELSAYLLKIARSKLVNETRARWRLRSRPDPESSGIEEFISAAQLPDEAAESAELADLAQRSLISLSADLREVVVLRLYEGLDYASIGEVVGTSAATARSRMRYALQSLRRTMDGIMRSAPEQ